MKNQLKDNQLKWIENSKTEILKTPIATINESLCTASSGLQGKYIVIDSRDWVIVIPSVEDCFLMVKQWRHGEKALSIEFPGGVIDDGESPEEGARRELLEETGCSAEKLVYLGKMNPNPAFMGNHVHFFAAWNLKDSGKQKLDSDEFLNCFKMKKQEVFARMGSDEMPHALMGSALMMYRQYSENH